MTSSDPTSVADVAQDVTSLKSLILSVPPALTILGHFSLLYFIGPIAVWIEEHWLAMTRRFWGWIFANIDWIALTDAQKDYLTTLVFFLPVLIFGIRRRKSDCILNLKKGRKGIGLSAATIAGFLIVYMLAQQATENLERMTQSFLAITIIVMTFGTGILWTIAYETALKLGAAQFHRTTDQTPLSNAAWRLHLIKLMCVAIITLATAFFDLLVYAASGFPYVEKGDFSWFGWWTSPFPDRSLAATGGSFVFVILTSSHIGRINPKPKKPFMNGKRLSLHALVAILIAFFAFVALTMTINVGALDAAFCAAIAIVVLTIVFVAPTRLMAVAFCFALLLGSSYAVWMTAEIKLMVEGLG